MATRTPLGEYKRFALTLLLALSGGAALLAQQQPRIAAGVPAPSAAPQTNPAENPASSTEQGQIPLIDAFQTGREWLPETRRNALRDTEFRFNIRSFYFDRQKFDGTKSEAFTIGGWVGVKTGYFFDHISLGATGYTSQKLVGDIDKDGTGLLKPGQREYTVLGEAFIDLRIVKDVNLYIGRKEFETPFINGDNTRMTPNTFQAIVLQGKTKLGANGGELKYGAGYFDEIKTKNSDRFVSMAEAAGANVNRGVYAAGALYQKGNFTIGGIDYYSPDIINISYAETTLKVPLCTDWESRFAAQFIDQRSVGNDLLQGNSFSGQQVGAKAELQFKTALFTMSYTHTTDSVNMRTPWGAYPGYTSVQVQDFNRAGEDAFLIRAGYEFTKVKGLSAYALAVFGTDPTEAGQYRQNEYNLNLQWKPPEGVLKGFSFRLRYGIVQQNGGAVQDLQDLRLICNYGLTF